MKWHVAIMVYMPLYKVMAFEVVHISVRHLYLKLTGFKTECHSIIAKSSTTFQPTAIAHPACLAYPACLACLALKAGITQRGRQHCMDVKTRPDCEPNCEPNCETRSHPRIR